MTGFVRDVALMMVRWSDMNAHTAETIRIEAIRLARDQGASWSDIGAALGMTKQSAHKHYGRAVGEPRQIEIKPADGG